ncbi:START-like domain-containing protein [Ophiocordyceps camponoti-floridani]|uniref:START-like domain-containing protein n=1 Tax=Ophiocordyceps camponoti-floridani TaxID=2030778 RepID=A0A8H4VAN3_9HYPO|nr:START-like domain-containing protein [Ophiocordyceps camponoti-floridani]
MASERLVRLRGIDVSELPSASATAKELTPLLHRMLQEALALLDSMPPTGKEWKSKGIKTFPQSVSPVELYERNVPDGEGGTETWALRRSVHEDVAAEGTASWDEFDRWIRREHARAEMAFTPSVVGTRVRGDWECARGVGA